MKNIFTKISLIGIFLIGFIYPSFSQPVSVVASASDSTICNGTSSQLFVVATGGSGTYTYSWTSNPAGFTSNDQNPVVTPLSTTIYTVDVNDGNGTLSDNVTINVYDELTASIGSDQTICYNTAPGQLTSTVSGGDGTYSYQWQIYDGSNWAIIPSASNPTYQPGPLTLTTDYRLIVDDGANCGPDTTNSITITVFDELLASVGSDQTICYNTSPVPLTSTVSGGDGTYTYQWQIYDGSNWAIIPSATSPTYQPGILTETTLFQLAINDGANCGPVVTNSITITVYNELMATIESAQTICYNTTPDLLTSIVSGGDETYTYQWQDSPDGIVWTDISGATSDTYQPPSLSNTTHYQLNVDDEACIPVTSNMVSITVYPDFEIGEITGGNTPICYDDDAGTLQSNPMNGSGSYTITWYDGDNNQVGTGETYAIGLLTETTSFYYNAVDDEECGDENSDPIIITVYPEFEIGDITGGNTPICYDDDAGTLQSNPMNGSGSYTITWYDGDNNQVGTGETYAIGLLTETTSFYYNAVDDAGCGNEDSDPITITVYPEFEIGDISGGTTPICHGDDAGPFQANPSNGSGSYTITWYDGDNNIVGNGASLTVSSLTETTSYYYNAVDDAGCGDENSTEVTINVNPMIDAAVSITVSKNPTCDNEEVHFQISDSVNAGNNPDFEWLLNNVTQSTGPTWTSLVNDNDEVTVQMTSYAACLNNNPVIADPITMTVNASPVLLNNGELVPKPIDNPVVLICVDSIETNTYHWFEDGVEIPDANEQFYYPSKYNRTFNFNSEYYMMIENEFCSSNTNTYTYVLDKSALFEESEVFIIYPNPNNGNFSLMINEEVVPENFESADIRILDVSGKVVYKEEIFSVENGLELSGIQNGIYFLEVIISENQHQVVKLIID